MSLDQILILILGVGAVFVSQSKVPRVARWACLLGLASQPAWFYASYTAEQWGIFFSAFLYTFSWLRGVKNHWLPVLQFWWKGRDFCGHCGASIPPRLGEGRCPKCAWWACKMHALKQRWQLLCCRVGIHGHLMKLPPRDMYRCLRCDRKVDLF